MGACVFTLDSRGKFEPLSALRALAQYPITTWCAPPTALRLMVAESLSDFRFPHLRHCVSAGEPLNPEVLAAWKAATGLTIYDGYGQTETIVLVGNFRSRGEEVRPGSMGKPTPGFTVANVFNSSSTPSRCRIGTSAGSSDSPTTRLSDSGRSMMRTFWPARAKSIATMDPATPPPTTQTS